MQAMNTKKAELEQQKTRDRRRYATEAETFAQAKQPMTQPKPSWLNRNRFGYRIR